MPATFIHEFVILFLCERIIGAKRVTTMLSTSCRLDLHREFYFSTGVLGSYLDSWCEDRLKKLIIRLKKTLPDVTNEFTISRISKSRTVS